MSTFLVGSTSEYTVNNLTDYVYFVRSQAVETCNDATEFRVYCSGSGNVKVAIYADDGGVLTGNSVRVGYNDSEQAVVSGWNNLTVSNSDIVDGNYYWLVVISDADVVRRETSGGTSRYGYKDHATYTFADPLGVVEEGSLSVGSHLFSLALYGEIGGSGTPLAVYLNQLRQQGVI